MLGKQDIFPLILFYHHLTAEKNISNVSFCFKCSVQCILRLNPIKVSFETVVTPGATMLSAT